MIKIGFVIIALGLAPLLLYVVFGPADGNPIGLGLLMTVAVPVGALIVVLGLLRRFFGRRSAE